ncbi:MAG: DUF2752 domain-containing protein [Clostridia bacterium]|nr:DUF2752 domain-containing protein [Clostridia bacterium]
MRKSLTVKLLIFDGSLVLITLAYAIAFTLSKQMQLHIFDCSFLLAFGFPCPGCGGSRAVLSLLKLRLVASFFYNPTVLCALILIVIHNVFCVLSIAKNDAVYFKKFKLEYYILVPVILIFNFVLRAILLKFNIDVISFAGSLSF